MNGIKTNTRERKKSSNSSSSTTFFRPSFIQTKLTIGKPNDKYEQEADAVSDQIMQMPQNEPGVQTKCAECAEEGEELQTKPMLQKMDAEEEEELQSKPLMKKSKNGGGIATSALTSQLNNSKGSGSPLPEGTNSFMSQAFSSDFSNVKVHTGSSAVQMNQGLNARAFTHGADVYFNKGEYSPNSSEGKRLLGHELTHVVQQENYMDRQIQKKGKDKLCETYNSNDTHEEIKELGGKYSKELNEETKFDLINKLKYIHRCDDDTNEAVVLSILTEKLGEEAQKIWDISKFPLSGYRGMYPEYAPDLKSRLKKLGIEESSSFKNFERKTETGSGSINKRRAHASAATDSEEVLQTDILYFRGHHYGRYKVPGQFASFDEKYGVDLRFLDNTKSYSKVKLIISTSCALLCKEAVETFHSLFPNAVILGYRGGAPEKGGLVRSDFQEKLLSLNTPLLLDKDFDVETIIDSWKEVITKHHNQPNSRHPGWYKNGNVHYWDGVEWTTIASSDVGNKCKIKEDFSDTFPGP